MTLTFNIQNLIRCSLVKIDQRLAEKIYWQEIGMDGPRHTPPHLHSTPNTPKFKSATRIH